MSVKGSFVTKHKGLFSNVICALPKTDQMFFYQCNDKFQTEGHYSQTILYQVCVHLRLINIFKKCYTVSIICAWLVYPVYWE